MIYTSANSLPPGPRWPAAVQLARYTLRPGPFLERCAARFGDPFTVKLAGYGSFVMVSSPEAIKDIFRGDPQVLHSGEANEFLSLTVGMSSVLVLDEEPHRRQRRVLLPPFQGERMRAFFGVMRAAADEEIGRWPVGRYFPVLPRMREITLQIILRAVLGLPAGDELDRLGRLVTRLLHFGGTRFALILVPLLPHWLLKESRWMPYYGHLKAVDEMLYAIIARRRAVGHNERSDVLGDLLDARHEEGQPLSDQEIRDAVITMLVAGHETTTVALAWVFELVLARADVVDAIRTELAAVTGGSTLEAEHLPRLEYLDAVIRESLRLRTVIPFVTRLLKKSFVAGGREYPAGTNLSPCIHLVHRRPEVYSEPEQFRPERFLERRFGPNEWLPFGGGNRLCIGMAFALYEMKIVLATVFSKLTLERPDRARTKMVRRGILIAPADGTRLLVRARR